MSYHIITPDPSEGNTPRRTASGYLKCTVCKYGVLENKKLYRLSGPAVVIGYILLIPSVLGMIASLLLLLGVIVFNPGDLKTEVPETSQQSADVAKFRNSCRDGFIAKYTEISGSMPTHAQTTAYCECILSGYHPTVAINMGSLIRFCSQQLDDGTLPPPSSETEALYFPTTQQLKGDTLLWNILRIFGGAYAIIFGIASFVGGLLGWLLVMKKHVLQCNACGATINAS